ncbi:MAG: TolC family protein [Blastocatellales bacterium]
MSQPNRSFLLHSIRVCFHSLLHIILIGAALTISASAQQPGPAPAKQLTLEDCVRLAESVPNSIGLAQQEREIADRVVTQARTGFLPQAEILSGFVYNSPRLDDRSTFSFVPLNGIRQYTALGAVTEELDTSGRLRAELQRARANQQFARVSVEIARRDLRRTVAIAYYRLLLTRHLLTVISDVLKESRDFEQRTKLLFDHGESARADVVKASAQSAFLQQALNGAEIEAKLANQDLAAFWTKEVDEPLAIVDSLEAPLPSPESATVTTPANKLAPYLKRLEFSLFDAEKRGFEADAKIARSALLPQFNFVYQYGLDSNSFRFRERGQAVYFNLRIPVFDWFRARDQSEQFKLRVAQVETNRVISERQFSREYRNALMRVQQLFSQIGLTQEQVRLAEEDLRLSRIRYEGGEGTLLDVVTAQNQLAQARNNYFTSVANYLNARADLEVASGK